MPEMYTETVPTADLRQALAAATCYVPDFGFYVLRITDHSGKTHNFVLDPEPFAHLRSMIESSILDARSHHDE